MFEAKGNDMPIGLWPSGPIYGHSSSTMFIGSIPPFPMQVRQDNNLSVSSVALIYHLDYTVARKFKGNSLIYYFP